MTQRAPKIGVIGAGIAGLHLGLLLQQAGIEATIFTEHTSEQLRASRLANIVVRAAPTRERERLLGVAHWDTIGVNLTHYAFHLAGEHPLAFTGVFDQPAMSVDMRIYCARLLEDYIQRGSDVRYGVLQADDLTRLSEEYDLVVAATGRGALGALFPRIAERSPFSAPQRLCVGGLFRGVALERRPALGVTIVRGHGEILSFPVFSFEPGLTGIAFESITGGAFETLARMRYADDPQRFEMMVVELLRTHAPAIHARIDPDTFALSRPLDLCHAAITPTARAGYIRLDNGRYVVALGDAHVVNDPIIGQGANTAVYAAWTLGAAIRETSTYDEAFCREVERRIWAFTGPVTAGTNARLGPPQPHLLQVLQAAAQDQVVADGYAWSFNHPDRFWSAMASPEGAAAFLANLTHDGRVASGV
jgi:2-polyprenyl-6-methoxyphenol hydroxylase-like FAD-dependent oxidoreductase